MSSSIKPFKETGIPSYHRRSFKHNYYNPFIYHIILKKQKQCEHFGKIKGDARLSPGSEGCAEIEESNLGKIIAKEIIHLKFQFPIIKLHQFKVMPDHIHILLQLLWRSDHHLEFYIDQLRINIARKYSRLKGDEINEEEIFEPGFCDKPLYEDRSLSDWYVYIRENPHRLAMRKQYPQFFSRNRHLKIGAKVYESYGNLFLLRNPDKIAVKMSSRFSKEIIEEKIKNYKFLIETGTILVSPFIHPLEKAIKSYAEETERNLILIQHQEFGERFKPARHDFILCSEGHLLIISLGYPEGTILSRKICEEMNQLALQIAGTC